MPGLSDPEPFATFDVELSPADRNLFYLEAVIVSPLWQRHIAARTDQARWSFIGGSILVAIGLIPALSSLFPRQAPGWMNSGNQVLYGLVMSGVGGWMIHKGSQIRKALADRIHALGRQCADPLEAYTHGPLRYEFSEAQVVCTSTHRTATAGWPLINEVVITPSFVMVSEFGPGSYLIPRHAFASDAAVTEFVTRVRAIMNERGATAADRIRAHLAYHDVKCPTCGYDLKGSTGETCPECGLALTLLNIPGATEQTPE